MTRSSRFSFYKLLLVACCGIALGVLVCAGGCGKKTAPDPFANEPKADFVSKDASIKNDMTYEEVVKLVGAPGKDITMPPPPDAPADVKTIKQYRWVDSDKNILIIYFQNNKLVSKNISKLP